MQWNDSLNEHVSVTTWEERQREQRMKERQEERERLLREQGYYYDDEPPKPPPHTFERWLNDWWGLLAAFVAIPIISIGVNAFVQADRQAEREQIEKNIASCEKSGGEVAKFSGITKCLVDGQVITAWYDDGSKA